MLNGHKTNISKCSGLIYGIIKTQDANEMGENNPKQKQKDLIPMKWGGGGGGGGG